jgi:hypothetical protein
MRIEAEFVLQDPARHARGILRKGDWNQIRRASDERGGGTSKQREFHGGISRGESRSEQ